MPACQDAAPAGSSSLPHTRVTLPGASDAPHRSSGVGFGFRAAVEAARRAEVADVFLADSVAISVSIRRTTSSAEVLVPRAPGFAAPLAPVPVAGGAASGVGLAPRVLGA